MAIGLIQIDGKLPNLALMKISNFYKRTGEMVEFVVPGRTYEKVYASVLFSWNRDKALEWARVYPDLEVGGTGYDIHKTLPPEIDAMSPDYDLYTVEQVAAQIRHGIRSKESTLHKAQDIVNMGIGFTSRGCFRNCAFCVVPKKEGQLRQENKLADLINPRSNIVTLYDNNLTADPDCLEKLNEIKQRQLVIDISQGIDIRILKEEQAKALSEVKHLRSIHYAWDLMEYEAPVLAGIKRLSKYIKPYRQMCFCLVGFNTTREEDMARIRKLAEMDVKPYVMKYNNCKSDPWLNHFARWVNGHFYKTCSFDEYLPWIKQQEKEEGCMDLFAS
ncbi:hypothetical protein [Anaeromusa acidaminophila]|uniref:hypothetical protein n=1 Tax=Anaeromusa acidaminophila TaxID=81464 RepID=UPI00037C13A7|nr:hypothetical protein [Anaeromusa acidaminophila]